MVALGELFTNPLFWIFLGILSIVVLYSLRSYFTALLTALFFDYAVDAGLSFSDNLLGGVGFAGGDIGDLAAGILLFMKYRKQVGWGWALLFFAEAANFGLSVIPGIGEGIEMFFNFFPLVTIVIMWKQSQANAIYFPIKEYQEYLKNENPEMSQRIEGEVKRMEALYTASDYQELLKEGKGFRESLFGEVKQIIQGKLNQAQQHLIETLEKEAEQGTFQKETIDTIRAAIGQAQGELETDWKQADADANQILASVQTVQQQVRKAA